MSRFPILAAFCLVASPAALLAQAPSQPAPGAAPPAAGQAPAEPPPAELAAVQQAGIAFGQCLQTGVQAVPATATPEAGAAGVLSGCAAQRQQLEQAAQALIATLPEDQRAGAQERLRTELGGVEAQIAAGIRQQRTPAAAPATPAPAPGN